MPQEKTSDFLRWLADRLVNVYGESENVDFVLRLREVAKNIDELGIMLRKW